MNKIAPGKFRALPMLRVQKFETPLEGFYIKHFSGCEAIIVSAETNMTIGL
jgi:hypothetical protein